jgi:ATP phosphoribosyltransferase regulatory subunit
MTGAGMNPGLWSGEASRLRAVERRLLGLWAGAGYAEVIPPLLMPEEAAEAASPEALLARTLRLRPNGDGALALRADFTAGVAWMASRRAPALEAPLRVCYAGAVMRKPAADRNEGLESLQAGCERLSPEPGPEGDEEMVRLAAASLQALELEGAIFELGHWGLVGPLLDRIPWPAEARLDLERALNRKSVPALDALADHHGRCPEWGLLRELLHLGGRPDAVDGLLPKMRDAGVDHTWEELRGLEALVRREFPGLPVRTEPTDVRHWAYYSGLTLKAFSPRHPYAVLSGGRYDGLYPALGRPWGACGFAVYTGRLLEG